MDRVFQLTSVVWQVIGLYPLLPDNTCHLLAADYGINSLFWVDHTLSQMPAVSAYLRLNLAELAQQQSELSLASLTAALAASRSGPPLALAFATACSAASTCRCASSRANTARSSAASSISRCWDAADAQPA